MRFNEEMVVICKDSHEKRIALAELIIAHVMKFDLRNACIQARIYIKKYKEFV